MSLYNVQNQWGGNNAAWHPGGIFNIGNRGSQLPIALQITSNNNGTTFTGTMTYVNEGPIGVRATLVTMDTYHVENQWGGPTAPWHDAGFFLLGARNGQNPVAFDIKSSDNGKTFTGTMTYAGEGPIGFQGVLTEGYAYNAANQWGGPSAPSHPGGQWVLGCRANQPVVALAISSSDNGKTLTGTMTYAGEGPIGFRGTRTMANTYQVENQWGGSSAPWHPGGQFVIGCRGDAQGVVAVNAQSTDGINLNGTMTYYGEGPIGLSLSAAVAAGAVTTPVASVA
jgi:OAA-family lectin sugar binding domain